MDLRFHVRVRYPAYPTAVCLLALCGCHTKPSPVQIMSGGAVRPLPQTSDLDDGEWHRATKDFSNHRYSQLDLINASNVSRLRVAFTFSTGVAHGQEAALIVANKTMYRATPWPNVLYALDLTKPGAPLK